MGSLNTYPGMTQHHSKCGMGTRVAVWRVAYRAEMEWRLSTFNNQDQPREWDQGRTGGLGLGRYTEGTKSIEESMSTVLNMTVGLGIKQLGTVYTRQSLAI